MRRKKSADSLRYLEEAFAISDKACIGEEVQRRFRSDLQRSDSGFPGLLPEMLIFPDCDDSKKKFCQSVLSELYQNGVISRILKHDVSPGQLVSLLEMLPSVLVEPKSDRRGYLDGRDTRELQVKVEKIVRSAEDLRREIGDIPDRMKTTLDAGISLDEVTNVLRHFSYGLNNWKKRQDELSRIISLSPVEQIQKPFPKKNKPLALLMVMVKKHIGDRHTPLARDIFRTKAVQELLGVSREISEDTTKTIKKSLRKMDV